MRYSTSLNSNSKIPVVKVERSKKTSVLLKVRLANLISHNDLPGLGADSNFPALFFKKNLKWNLFLHTYRTKIIQWLLVRLDYFELLFYILKNENPYLLKKYCDFLWEMWKLGKYIQYFSESSWSFFGWINENHGLFLSTSGSSAVVVNCKK